MNNDTTTRIARAAARDEQQRADLAMLACPVAYLARVGVSSDALDAAYQRTLAYVGDLRAILRPTPARAAEQPALFDAEQLGQLELIASA